MDCRGYVCFCSHLWISALVQEHPISVLHIYVNQHNLGTGLSLLAVTQDLLFGYHDTVGAES
jgi:hypothetical protein